MKLCSQTPTQMPDTIEFEPLLFLAYDAYSEKTGEEFNCNPIYNYETGSNNLSWMKI